jgi:hypothetical protein
MPPDDLQMISLLCANGIGNQWEIRWQLNYTRVLSHYHAIMIMDNTLMDWASERHSKAAKEQRRMEIRAAAYLALTR